MSKYTIELRSIVDDYDIFDFTYTRSAASQAIISDTDLEQGFIDRYYFRELGFETLERFKQRLKVRWLEEIEIFDKLLVAYEDTISVKSNLGSTTTNKSVFNDTPKSKLDTSDYATSITDNTQNVEGKAGITDIELLELYHDKIKDIKTEFYDKFDDLFMQIF